MSSMSKFWRLLCDELFKPSGCNNREDTDALIEHCLNLIVNAGYPEPSEDHLLEFVYRAGEILEIQEKGFCYIKVRNAAKRGGWDTVLAPEQGKLGQGTGLGPILADAFAEAGYGYN